MDTLLAFMKQLGWEWLLTFASYIADAAAELAQSEGVDPDVFDERVRQLEATRRTDFASLVDKWKGMLKP